MTIGDLALYVIRRESRFALRVKDAQSPSITAFHGLEWYPPEETYRVTAKWIPYVPFKTITLATLVGTNYDQPVPDESRSEEHTSELQSPDHLVCRLLLEKKKKKRQTQTNNTTKNRKK